MFRRGGKREGSKVMSDLDETYPRFVIQPNGSEDGDSRDSLTSAIARGDALVRLGFMKFFTVSRVDHGPAAFGCAVPVPVYDSRPCTAS